MRRWIFVLFVTVGCDLDLDRPDLIDYRSPSCRGDAAEVGGTWTITGRGSRSGCDDENLNAPGLTLGSTELSVTQSDSALFSAGPSAGFFLSGEVEGLCVGFISEETWEDETLTYFFSGEVRDLTTIVGTFEGRGPEDCKTAGSFEIQRRP